MAALHAACFTLPLPWSEPEFAATIASRFVFVLDRADGFLLGQVVAGEAELLTIAVAPLARRRGIGAALVQAFVQESRARGAQSAFLEVSEANPGARALYEACGFAATGRRRGYYRAHGRVEDAILMGRPL